MSYYLGIDPGQSGGIAIVNQNQAHAWKMPETERDTAELIESIKGDGDARMGVDCDIKMAVIESVHSMPKQGVASSFKFGRNYGFLRGLLIGLRIPFVEVTPQKWQKVMGCQTHGDKNVSKARAQQKFPSLKITHATADALLLAEYCRLTDAQLPGLTSWDDL